LQQVIRAAYGIEDDRIIGAPDWLSSEKYDIEASEEASGSGPDFQNAPDIELAHQGIMLQAVLAERLKLVVHRETRPISIYALVIAPGGPKLQEAKPGEIYTKGPKGPDGVVHPGMKFDQGAMLGQGIGIDALVFHISRELRRTVLNETGLSGKYDFTVKNP